MRTDFVNYFHTFYPEAQAELDELIAREKRLTRMKARQPEGEDAPKRRMSDPAPNPDAELDEVRAGIEKARKKILSGVVRLHLKGLGRGEFRALLSEHPPRDEEPHDKTVGYNVDTFGEALIAKCLFRTESVATGREVKNRWDEWADEMTDGQWEEVFAACLRLTQSGNPALPR